MMSLFKIFIISQFSISVLFADTNNPFKNVISNSKPGDSQFFTSTSTIQDHSKENADNGREYKAGDAASQAGAGMGAAITAGSLLTAKAIPKLASPFPSVVAEGVRLMTMAGLEFAQAAADAKNRGQNSGQKNTLTAEAGQSGSQVSFDDARSAAEASVNSPELSRLLADRGISPDDFSRKLTSGQLTDPSEIIAALGDKTPFSQTDKELISNLGTAPTYDNSGEKTVLQGMDDSRGSSTASLGASQQDSASNSSVLSPANFKSENEQAGEQQKNYEKIAVAEKKTEAPNRKSFEKEAPTVGKSGNVFSDIAGMQKMLLNIITPEDDKNPSKKKPVASRDEMASIGVVVASGKLTIFQIGGRHYRSYRKWRGIHRVAKTF